MIDNSRNAVMKVETIKHLIRILALNGFNELQLYTEDTIYVDGNPYFGYLRGRLTKEEIREVVRYASLFSIEVVPCIQTLAHLEGIFKWDEYSSIKDIDNILLVDETKTYTLIEDIVRTCSEIYTSKKINIGMDEAHFLGRGKYQDKHGYRNRVEILTEHLARVKEIADKHGFTMMMWSDMFIRLHNDGEYYGENIKIPQETIENVPNGVELIYWDYYSKDKEHYDHMLATHADFKNPIGFAGENSLQYQFQ
jgi:N-acetyl-beta-hexosaminidase